MGKLKALSLFSGAGGMDIGVKKAGFDILAEIEIDKYCCQTLRAACKREKRETSVIETDIRTVNPATLMSDHGLKLYDVDLLFGGPPCQPFSLAGKQNGLDDLRGPLIFEVIRFTEAVKPKVIMLEQVKGLLSAKGKTGKRGEVFQTFLTKLERLGYTPKWQVCCAADFGVPQLRERVIVVATYGGNGFMFPTHTNAPQTDAAGLFDISPYVTVGEALAGLGEPAAKTPGTTFFDQLDSHVDVTPPRDRERIAGVPEGSYLAAQTHLGKSLLCNLSRKDTTKYLRLDRRRPSNTLRCGEIFYHPTENRYLTPREYMRLHGYDDNYYLFGPIRSRTGVVKNLDQHRQVANSVPPPLAHAVAKQIKGFLHE